MKKTGQQIITDVIALIRESVLVTDANGVNGEIYRPGTRPRNSVSEDIVVIFTTGDGAQFQSGVVTLNVYVPYFNNGQNGVMVPDSERCEAIEALAQETVDGLKAYRSDYRFSLRETIHTQEEDEINQSFVVVRLGFSFIN